MFCSDFLEAPTLKREHKKGCSIWHIKFTILNFIRYWSLSTLDFKILKWLFALKFFINREKKRLFLVFKGIMVYQIQNAECSFAGKMFHILNLNQSCTPQYSLNDGRILYTMEVHLTRKTNWILYKTNSGQKKKKRKRKIFILIIKQLRWEQFYKGSKLPASDFSGKYRLSVYRKHWMRRKKKLPEHLIG